MPLFALLAVLALLTILRENGVVTLNYWESSWQIDTNIDSHWKSTTSAKKFDLSRYHLDVEVVPYANAGDAQHVAELIRNWRPPIDGSLPATLQIKIQLYHSGTAWMPLRKRGKCRFIAKFVLTAESVGEYAKYTGDYTGDAEFATDGICATRTFYEEVHVKIGRNIVAKLDEWLRDQLD